MLRMLAILVLVAVAFLVVNATAADAQIFYYDAPVVWTTGPMVTAGPVWQAAPVTYVRPRPILRPNLWVPTAPVVTVRVPRRIRYVPAPAVVTYGRTYWQLE
jgi:hypothetical protein